MWCLTFVIFVSDSTQYLKQKFGNKSELPVTCGNKDGVLHVKKYNDSRCRQLIYMWRVTCWRMSWKHFWSIQTCSKRLFCCIAWINIIRFQWRSASSVKTSGLSPMNLKGSEERREAKNGRPASFVIIFHSRNSLRCIKWFK